MDFERGLPDQYRTISAQISPVHLPEQTNKQANKQNKGNDTDIFYTQFKPNLACRKHTIKLPSAFPFCDLLKL